MEAKLSPYYSYGFVSPEPVISLVKEEFKGYLDTGAVDDAIWSIYVDKCLRKLGKGMLQITPFVGEVCNYEFRLPDNFDSVREAWLCTFKENSPYQLPGAQYSEVSRTSITSKLTSTQETHCAPCTDCCEPDIIKVAYKTTQQIYTHYAMQYLLKPGNMNANKYCSVNSPNLSSSCDDTFDIAGNKFRTNFREGTVYLLYYAKDYDEITGYQLIPDNFRIQEYIELFIKQKVYEQLCNQVTDETYNQIEKKADKYKALADEAYIIASIEDKKDTVYKKRQRTIREKHRFDKYRIR